MHITPEPGFAGPTDAGAGLPREARCRRTSWRARDPLHPRDCEQYKASFRLRRSSLLAGLAFLTLAPNERGGLTLS